MINGFPNEAPYRIQRNADQTNLCETCSIDGVANDYVVFTRTETHQMSTTENKTKQNSTENNSYSKYISTFSC